MPGHDDTLNAGGPGPIVDPLDELCTCGHTRGEHHTLDEDCTVIDPECPCLQFEAVNAEFGNSEPSTETLRARLAALEETQRDLDAGGETPTGEDLERLVEKHRPRATRNNTHEAADKTHADLAQEMDREPMSPVESMSEEERIESDAVQAETLANLCTCGHPYGLHTVLDNHCGERDCLCLQFEPLLKPADSAIDHEALERARQLPYTPPLLRKRLIGEDELRQVLADVGRLDLLQQLPEVDRVTTNYGAEHWQEIERLALFPQGSSGAEVSDRTTTAIARCLVDLRQSLGATYQTEELMRHIERNAVIIRETGQLLDRVTERLAPNSDKRGESGST